MMIINYYYIKILIIYYIKFNITKILKTKKIFIFIH
jgi:hypothetical protein